MTGSMTRAAFGPGQKASLAVDVQHMDSNGYQTWNQQTRNGGSHEGAVQVLGQDGADGLCGRDVAGCEYAELQPDALPDVWRDGGIYVHGNAGAVCGVGPELLSDGQLGSVAAI